jgi:hypothetical protein
MRHDDDDDRNLAFPCKVNCKRQTYAKNQTKFKMPVWFGKEIQEMLQKSSDRSDRGRDRILAQETWQEP